MTLTEDKLFVQAQPDSVAIVGLSLGSGKVTRATVAALKQLKGVGEVETGSPDELPMVLVRFDPSRVHADTVLDTAKQTVERAAGNGPVKVRPLPRGG